MAERKKPPVSGQAHPTRGSVQDLQARNDHLDRENRELIVKLGQMEQERDDAERKRANAVKRYKQNEKVAKASETKSIELELKVKDLEGKLGSTEARETESQDRIIELCDEITALNQDAGLIRSERDSARQAKGQAEAAVKKVMESLRTMTESRDNWKQRSEDQTAEARDLRNHREGLLKENAALRNFREAYSHLDSTISWILGGPMRKVLEAYHAWLQDPTSQGLHAVMIVNVRNLLTELVDCRDQKDHPRNRGNQLAECATQLLNRLEEERKREAQVDDKEPV